MLFDGRGGTGLRAFALGAALVVMGAAGGGCDRGGKGPKRDQAPAPKRPTPDGGAPEAPAKACRTNKDCPDGYFCTKGPHGSTCRHGDDTNLMEGLSL